MCPWSGRMSVLVALRIVAPVRLTTMCTVGPLTDSPLVGEMMDSAALDDGRGPGEVADGLGDGVCKLLVGAGAHPAAVRSAASDAMARMARWCIGVLSVGCDRDGERDRAAVRRLAGEDEG